MCVSLVCMYVCVGAFSLVYMFLSLFGNECLIAYACACVMS